MLMQITIFLFGSIVGSFLNVVILRQSVGKGRRKRSICLSCGKKIENRDLVPIFSYLALAGRCRHCKSRISSQYILVEVMMGLFFVLAYHLTDSIVPISIRIFDWVSLCAIGAVLMVAFVYDLRHKIIPDWTSVALAILVFVKISVTHFFAGDLGTIVYVKDILAGVLSALPFFLLWLISGGRWMGLGDAKLMIGLGMLLGWKYWFTGFAVSFWIASAVVLTLMMLGKLFSKVSLFSEFSSMGRKSEVPLGPFLIAGCLLVYFLQWDLLSFIV